MSKSALVVGGTGGIGSQIARDLIEDGFRVFATYSSNKEKAQNLSDQLGGENISFYMMDAADETSVKNAMAQISDSCKSLDVVVFSVSAGLAPAQFFNTGWADFQKHIDVQVRGLYNIVRALMPQIKAKHKLKIIVILTELCAGKPSSNLSGYITAKYGLMGLARVLAIELARYNCTVNAISPGLAQTPLVSGLPAKLMEIAAEQNFMKRLTEPKDVSGAARFLASDKSDYMNGSNIVVNGGGAIF